MTTAGYVDAGGVVFHPPALGSELWLIVHALDQESWYPYGQLALSVNGTWQRRIGIGPTDPKRVTRELDFRIIVAECTQEAVNQFEAGRARADFGDKGMEPLATGFRILAQVTVRRFPA